MVHDNEGRVDAITVPSVKNISHPVFVSQNTGWMIDVLCVITSQSAHLVIEPDRGSVQEGTKRLILTEDNRDFGR